MVNSYELKNGQVVPSGEEQAAIKVFVCDTEQDKKLVIETLQLDAHDVDSALDPEEISRIDLEYDKDRIFLIWKQPLNVTFEERLQFKVASVGILLEPNQISFIVSSETVRFGTREYQSVESVTDVLLRFLLATTRHYLEHLKGIKLIKAELESKINTSMDNKYLLQMFALSESLTYFMNAIAGNELVLTKLNVNPRRANLSERQVELLDDIRLDNQQCARQAQVYSMVMSGLMDARGTIVNNNMNVLLRDLTILNVIFLPLNLIASIGGMSEYSMMTEGMDWRLSYTLFFLTMALVGWLTWWGLVRMLRRREGMQSGVRPA